MHKHIFRHGERKKFTAKTTKMKYILMFFIVEMSEKKMLDAPTEHRVREPLLKEPYTNAEQEKLDRSLREPEVVGEWNISGEFCG